MGVCIPLVSCLENTCELASATLFQNHDQPENPLASTSSLPEKRHTHMPCASTGCCPVHRLFLLAQASEELKYLPSKAWLHWLPGLFRAMAVGQNRAKHLAQITIRGQGKEIVKAIKASSSSSPAAPQQHTRKPTAGAANQQRSILRPKFTRHCPKQPVNLLLENKQNYRTPAIQQHTPAAKQLPKQQQITSFESMCAHWCLEANVKQMQHLGTKVDLRRTPSLQDSLNLSHGVTMGQ